MRDNVAIPVCTCARCGHKWYLRRPQLPRLCPRCKSPYWRTGSEYKQELEEDIQKALFLEKELTKVMEELSRNPQRWAEVVKIGWKRMFETSDFPVKNLGPVLDAGFSIHNWFVKVHEIAFELVSDLAQKLDNPEEKIRCDTGIPEKTIYAMGWDGVLENLNEEGIKILAFLWFADSLASPLHYPEAEAIIQEKAWLLLEEKMGRKKQEILTLVEQMVKKIDEGNKGATCWAEVIRFP